ncbi:MAG: LamG-like jellyroll fold domain-containing protein, partial [Bacteriovoracaceae bacterium]
TSTSALTLNAGTIKDPAGNNANLTLPAVASAQSLSGNKALVVDTTPPIVTNVTSSTANATYGVNQALSLQVTFNDSMTVTGTPQLELETGATDRKANYTSGSGSSTLTFTYTVQPGDTSSDLAYTSTSALTLNSGTIKGPTGNNANLTLPAVASAQSLSGSKSLVVDAIPPTVLRVSSPTADGTFNTGESITIEITFNESLIVTGTPQLNLETGTIDQTVNYVSGSGSDTLSFTYTTQGGDTSSDLAYTSTSALTLNSGTIKDPDGNDASLTLPIIGSAQSLSGSKALVIDTVGILDQTDDDAAEFNSGNHTGTHFKNNVLTIDHQNESGELDASWTPQYNNIVAYWKMNGDFQDSIGTNHGTAQGGVTTTTDSHLGSEAGAFDGIQDYIATPLTIGTTVSISQWVSTTDLSSSPMLWRTGPIGIGPDLFIQRGTISLNTWDSNSNPYCSVPSFLTNGRFHHLVTVIDGTANTSSLYINGELCGNASYRDPTSTSFTISGGTGDPVRYEWNGKMDDVVAWNSSLSASEVQTIYNRQVKKYNTAELHESWTPKWSNLVGYWKMDEGSWNGTADEVKDSSGNGNHGVRVGDATTTSDAKVGSGAGTFDGSGDYILVDHSSDLDNLSQITVATWVKFGAEASWDAIICKRSTSRTFCLARDDTGGGYQFHITNSSNSGATAKSTSSIVTNEWKFVVGTYDGSEIKIYVNGVLETTTPQTGQIKTNTGHLAFALEGDNLTYPLNGSIDEVSIWNTELSSDDIALIYSRQSAKYSSEMKSRIIDSQDTSSSWDSLEWLTTLPFGKELPSSSESSADGQYSDIEDNLMDGLVGLWHFNEQSANTAPDLGSGNTDFVDYSGNSLHGDENGNISFGENGKFARGVIFDGVDDYIEMPNSIEPGAGNFSLSMWFKTNSSGVLQDLYSDIGDPILNYMYLSIEANNQLGAFVRDEDGDFVKILNRGPEVNDGLWHHVVMIRDDTKLSLYLDGVFIFEVSNANLGVVNLASGSSKPKVGSVFSANSRFFNGSMDELSIWSRALSSSEVTQLYRRGANRIKYQVRTCSSSDCSDQDALTGDGWIGPGGNHLTYFSELYNNSSTTHSCTIPMPCMESELTLDGIVNSIAPSLDFADFAGAPDDNRYFQYRVILESDDEGNACSGSPCLPEIKSITVGPEHTYFK